MNISLTKTYASLYDIYFLYKNYHWNIQNTQKFFELHELFDKHAKANFSFVDTVAERLRQLHQPAEGDMSKLAEESVIRDNKDIFLYDLTPQTMLKNLYQAHQALSEFLQNAKVELDKEQDFDTQDLIVDISRANNQMQWFIRSSIEPTK